MTAGGAALRKSLRCNGLCNHDIEFSKVFPIITIIDMLRQFIFHVFTYRAANMNARISTYITVWPPAMNINLKVLAIYTSARARAVIIVVKV